MPASKRVILITGASRGLGFSLCKRFYELGYKVAAVARNLEPLEELAKELSHDKDLIGELHLFAADATQESQASKAVREIVELTGKIDVLINNAGGIGGSNGTFVE